MISNVVRAETLFFARQNERIHLKLKWELYERVLNKILVRAVATEFELDQLAADAMELKQRQRIQESF